MQYAKHIKFAAYFAAILGLAALILHDPASAESCETRCKHKCPWYEVAGCVNECISDKPPQCVPAPASGLGGFHWPTCNDSFPNCLPPAVQRHVEHHSCEWRCNQESCNTTPAHVIGCVDHCLAHGHPHCYDPRPSDD